MATKKLCAFILFGGPPTQEQMQPILEKAGLERFQTNMVRRKRENQWTYEIVTTESPVCLSTLIALYAQTRNFQMVADRLWHPSAKHQESNVAGV